MVYPVIDFSFSPELSLTIPDPDKLRAAYETLLLSNTETEFPFWAKCWPSSLAMHSYLNSHPDIIKHKLVLELGAGIGLPSFFAAKTASSVIITDYAKEAVELMQININALGCKNVKALELDWNNYAGDIPADILLLSDVNYDERDFESLKLILSSYLEKGVTILLATPYRINASSFVTYFSLFIQEQELIAVQNEGTEVTIGLFVLKYKGE
ncbi:methyltransferase [Sediminibacterium sp. C3]|uniref:class I SAM-dependent methyltransferase n=1 Tax=Sediminibacterium sp. C3 TaxID=1267211 RepID=UPI0003FC97B8|nr:methyltransferase domain-containing protein [Sediminibacterium sp. C3]